MSENAEKTDKKKEPVVFENVKVCIEDRGKSYEYFMTDDIDVLCGKLCELGYRNVKESDWRLNSSLAQSVRDKMVELGCCFSMTFSHGTSILNFWTKNSPRPYYVRLDELLPFNSVLEKQMHRIKEDIAGTENLKKLAEQNSWTPLMMAIMMNSQESVKEYIAEKNDVNCHGNDGILLKLICHFLYIFHIHVQLYQQLLVYILFLLSIFLFHGNKDTLFITLHQMLYKMDKQLINYMYM